MYNYMVELLLVSMQVLTLALTLAFSSPALLAAWTLNMREGITEISRETYNQRRSAALAEWRSVMA